MIPFTESDTIPEDGTVPGRFLLERVRKRCQEPFSGGRVSSGHIDGGKRFLTPFP